MKKLNVIQASPEQKYYNITVVWFLSQLSSIGCCCILAAQIQTVVYEHVGFYCIQP